MSEPATPKTERRDERMLSSELRWQITRDMVENSPYRCLVPDQKPPEREALRQDILQHGIEAPVVFDEAGHPMDGHNRLSIYLDETEKVPVFECIIKHGLSEQEKRDYVRARNVARRHLNQNQRRLLCEAQMVETPHYSARKIGNIVGLDHHVVGDVRRKLVAEGRIPDVETTEGEDGRKRGKRQRPSSGGLQSSAPQVEELTQGNCRLLAGSVHDLMAVIEAGSVRSMLCASPADTAAERRDLARLATHVLRNDGLLIVPADTCQVAEIVSAMTPSLCCVDTICRIPSQAEFDEDGYTFAAALSLVFAPKDSGNSGDGRPLFAESEGTVLLVDATSDYVSGYLSVGAEVIVTYPPGTDLKAKQEGLVQASVATGKINSRRANAARSVRTRG